VTSAETGWSAAGVNETSQPASGVQHTSHSAAGLKATLNWSFLEVPDGHQAG
jgi:hypothetical protein